MRIAYVLAALWAAEQGDTVMAVGVLSHSFRSGQGVEGLAINMA